MLIRWVFLNLLALSLFIPTAQARETLTLNTVGKPPFSTVLHALLKEAFNRSGLDIKIQELPGRRALINADKGIEDGDAGRMNGTEKKYPNLVKIPESILFVNIVGFARNELEATLKNSWKGLEPYNVGILRGHQYSEKMVVHYKSLVKADDTAQLLTVLSKGRADVAVTIQIEGLSAIKKEGLKNIRILEPPLQVIPIFPYLHKKHTQHIAAIDKALKAMKADGSYARIRDEILDPYFALVKK